MSTPSKPKFVPTRLPPLLQPVLKFLPKDSLHLLTNVIGTSTSWLTIRYLCASLARDAATPAKTGHEQQDVRAGSTSVVIVSWARNYEFWRQETRRACVSVFTLQKLVWELWY